MRKLLTKQKPILSAALAILLIFIGMTGCAKKQTAPATTPSPTPTAAELSLTPTPSPAETSLVQALTPTPPTGTADPTPSEGVTPTASPNEASLFATPTVTTTVGPNRPTASPKPPTSTPRPSASPVPATRPPTPAPATPTPTQTPIASQTKEPAPLAYKNDVLAAINALRAPIIDPETNKPIPQLQLDDALCQKALNHAIAMADAGRIFHSGSGIESVSREAYLGVWQDGWAEGEQAVEHARGLLKPELTKLGVGAVAYKGMIYIVVCSTTAG